MCPTSSSFGYPQNPESDESLSIIMASFIGCGQAKKIAKSQRLKRLSLYGGGTTGEKLKRTNSNSNVYSGLILMFWLDDRNLCSNSDRSSYLPSDRIFNVLCLC